MKFSPQQDQALRAVDYWLRNQSFEEKPYFYLAGYAGTGKTTLAKYLTQDVPGLTMFAAFTGKAASVLRRNGCPEAMTLHSLLYSVSERSREKLIELQIALKELERNWTGLTAGPVAPTERQINRYVSQKKELEAQIQFETKRVRSPFFSVNPESILADASLLVLDECSMVDNRLGNDALTFGKKILVLGDPAQLPPVRGGGFFTSKKPDILLTEIHRQAAENPIIRWSKTIREGGALKFGREESEHGTCQKVMKAKVDREWYASDEAGQLLTGKNETRRSLNITCRRALGRRDLFPVEGEKLVILRNDKELGVLNGVVCTATNGAAYDPEYPDAFSISIDYEGNKIEDILTQSSHFHAYLDPSRSEDLDDRNLMQMDYGYALTVHKSQGSQWGNVTLCDDGFGKRDPGMRKKWLYTAVTRAESNLTIVV